MTNRKWVTTLSIERVHYGVQQWLHSDGEWKDWIETYEEHEIIGVYANAKRYSYDATVCIQVLTLPNE